MLEPLDRRIMLAVTASFSAASRELVVTGDDQDNVIVISRTAAGAILVNNGAIPILGDVPTVANTLHFHLVGAGGNDNISLDQTNGPLPSAALFGGAGNDTLTGGSGDDFADGDAGNDTILLGAGEDEFQWNPGDGSDIVDGQGGLDHITFNGSDLAENFELADTGAGAPFHHLRLTRDIGNVNMDLAGFESIDLNALGGADAITVNDLSGTDLTSLNLDIDSAANVGIGDNAADSVILNGTSLDDAVQIASFPNHIAVAGLSPFVNIIGEDGLDALTVNTLDGNDIVDAASLTATNASQLIKLTENGGAGNDTLIGSQGADTFTWNPGDGNDTIDGGDNPDTLIFNGSNLADKIDLSASGGGRIQLTRDLGGAIDLAGIENITVNALSGADTITVNDLTGTAVNQIQLNLALAVGNTAGDGQPDSVTVNGTPAADSIPVIGRAGIIVVDGGGDLGTTLPYFTVVRSVESNDALRINGNAGNDNITVDLDNTPVNLSIDAGAGHDTINVTATGPAATAATATILSSTGDDDLNVNTDGTGIANVRFDTTQRIGALTIGNGGLATLTATGGGSANVLTVTSLDLAPTARLDLDDNALIVDYPPTVPPASSPIASIRSLLQHGYAGGAWNGNGIMTSLGNPTTFALGFAEASDVAPGGTFAGQSVDGTAVVIKFTLYGDANLDGKVDFLDLATLAQSYNSTAANWSQGDFNFDGSVDFLDLARLAQNYNATLPASPAAAPAIVARSSPMPSLASVITQLSQPSSPSPNRTRHDPESGAKPQPIPKTTPRPVVKPRRRNR
jgi:hypothetical protein